MTKEWLEMARSEHTRQLQQLELEILKICRENLLPKLSSFQHEDMYVGVHVFICTWVWMC